MHNHILGKIAPTSANAAFLTKYIFLNQINIQIKSTYRASILKNYVSESNISLCFDFQVIWPFENHSFLEVFGLIIHVSYTVFTDVSNVLGSFFW